MQSALNVALKEWAVVCQALSTGRQMILLRKGGISESIGGFELKNREFLLFPTYLHQNVDMLKSEVHEHVEKRDDEPVEIVLRAAAEVTDIVQLKSRGQIDALDDEHIWTAPLIDMRFNYRPQNPLYLLLVRAYRLARPVTLANTPAYAGCKSWVPLERAIDVAEALPVLDEARYEHRRGEIMKRMR